MKISRKNLLNSWSNIQKFFLVAFLMLVTSMTAFAQQTAKGTVTDALGDPIIGASVLVKGTTTGTITDIDGNFELPNVKSGSTIVVSYIGYESVEVPFNGAPINVSLKESTAVLDDVVVTALGIKRQSRSLGYSTTQVKGEDFQLVRDPNVGSALSGKVAGVSVTGNATGSTGSSRVIIRGNASMTGNNMPLYVVDGIPFDNTNQGSAGQWGGSDGGDGLNNINADDIESIQVLKGAAASALYGYRGGNGAILITTKTGKKGKPTSIEVNQNLTFNTIYDMRDFQKVFGQGSSGTRPGNAMAAKDSNTKNWGEALGGTWTNFLGNSVPYEYVDNFKEFYRTGVTSNTSASISGAEGKVAYRFGVSYNKESSILPNAGNSQIGFNTNTTYDILKNLHLTVTANYTNEKSSGRSNISDGNGNTNAAILWHANGFNIHWMERGTEDAQWGTDSKDGKELLSGNSVYFNNPYWLQYRKTVETRKSRLVGAVNLKWDITSWLYLQGAVQRDSYTLESKNVQPIGAAADPNGYMSESNKNFYEMNYNFLLGFNKTFGDFNVGATFGGNKMVNTYKTYYPSDGGRPFVVYGLWSVNNLDSTDRRSQIGYAQYGVNSIYFTADLGWKNQLFLNVTGRNDWFSTLAKNSNSYFYPSVTLSWVFTDSFRNSLPEWFDFGKIRGSYASASNGTSPYQNALTYKVRDYKVNGVQVGTVNNSTYPNTDLKPVQISEYEVGLNLSFFHNALNFDMAYYTKNTKDDIVQVSTSNASGFTSRILNIGEIQNKGFEFMVDATPVRSKSWNWNTTLNFAINNSTVKYLGVDGEGNEIQRLLIDGAVANGSYAYVYNTVGEAYGQITGYKYKRDANGNLLLKNGLPQASENMESLGSGVYKFTGGWTNSLRYKNLLFSALIDFKFGAKIFSGTNLQATSNGLHKNTLVGRTVENPNMDYVFPGIDEETGQANTVAVKASNYYGELANKKIAEAFTYDASFIKLRELSLGYDFTGLLKNQKVINGLTLSFVARNLWTIMKKVDNIDPEASVNNTNGQGLELNGYPYQRNIGFNLNIKF